MKENTVEEYLVKQVKALKGEVRKVKWLDRNGAPDRLVMLPERKVIWKPGVERTEPAQRFLVETKAPKGKCRPEQLREHARLRKFGWRVEVVNSLERVDEVLA